MIIQNDINNAAVRLKQGGLVAFPTETVYGLGADAANEAAIRAIFTVKERPFDHPLIVHIASLDQLSDWAQGVSPEALQLAAAFWPGPLTLILKKQPWVLDVVTGGQDTVGIRIPRHPMAHALLQAFGGGVAAPSANKFTHISPTTAEAVRQEFGQQVDMVLDGGACEVGLESTIIDMSRGQPIILRPGMLNAAAIEAVLSSSVATHRQDTPAPQVPGMHHLHYAPLTATVLLATSAIPGFLERLTPNDLPVVIVSHTGFKHPSAQTTMMPNKATGYAHDLYHTLRLLDHQGFKRIIVEDVPASTEWDAIRDRLKKAAALR